MQKQCIELVDKKILAIEQIEQALVLHLESLNKKIKDTQATLEEKEQALNANPSPEGCTI